MEGRLPLTASVPLSPQAARSRRGARAALLLSALPFALLAAMILGAGIGAVQIAPAQVVSIALAPLGVQWAAFEEQQAAVFQAIRLPRVLLGALVGAGLGVAGAAMQGLFRNPLADPGLLGISSGAALAVAVTIVMGLNLFGVYSLPIAAFVGSLITTVIIYALAQQRGRLDVSTMLLAGIAVNSLAGAGTGLMTFLATDDQLRTITFWSLGSLGGATWESLATAAPLLLLGTLALPILGRALDALSLGEAGAEHLGVNVQAIKWATVSLVALCVGAGVAVAGSIGFVGLVVPHLLRLIGGPSHRYLLPASALLGATLLVLADLVARTVAAPAELPIGIVTAMLGAPFFLYLLRRGRGALL